MQVWECVTSPAWPEKKLCQQAYKEITYLETQSLCDADRWDLRLMDKC